MLSAEKNSEDYVGITVSLKQLEELTGKYSEHSYTLHLEAPMVNIWPHLLYLILCVCWSFALVVDMTFHISISPYIN